MKVSLKSQISDKTKECDGYISNIETLTKDLNKVNEVYSSYDLSLLKQNHLKYESYVGRLEEITHSLDSIKSDIEHKTEHLDGIGAVNV